MLVVRHSPVPTNGPDPAVGAVRDAVRRVPGCDEAGLALLSVGSPLAVVATCEAVRRVIEVQYLIGEGPCWTATALAGVSVLDDVPGLPASADGWLRQAQACGVTATISVPVPCPADTAGVLALYTRATRGWPPGAIRAATSAAWAAARSLRRPHRPPR